jgi:sugar transferase (PEP-CTERM system associated)
MPGLVFPPRVQRPRGWLGIKPMLKIFGHFIQVKMLALLILEMAVLGAAVYYLLSSGIHSPLLLGDLRGQFGGFSFLFALVVGAAMISMGLYSRSAMSDYRTLAIKVLIALALVVPANMAGTALFHEELYESANASTFWWLKAPVVWLLVILLTRILFSFANRREFMKRRIFILGAGTRAAAIRQMAIHGSNETFIVAGTFDPGTPVERRASRDSYEAIAEAPAEDANWVDVVRRAHATEIVVALEDRRGLPVSQLLRCKIDGIQVLDYQTFCERETCRLDLDELKPSWLIFGSGFSRGIVRDFFKRFFDIMVSSAFLLATLPVTLLAAILIKLESRGPVLYRQERVGLHGRPFMVLKLRSMRQDAEVSGAPQWARERDPRVTRVGAFTRKTRIDELPQLINVLRGEMSFVGPRPERPYFVEQLNGTIPFYRERHCVKPGITGWAQINYPYGASLEDARQKLSYDLYYAKNHSIFLDFIIILSTVRVILLQQGSR